MLSQRRLFLVLAVSATVLFWGSSFVAIRAALKDYGAEQLVCLRFLVSSFILFGIAIVRRVPLPRISDVLAIFLCGVLGITFYQLALSFGQKTVNAGAACLIINTAPIYTILLARVFLKEQFSPRIWIGTTISLAGTTLIALGESGGIVINRGAILIALAALCYAASVILQKPLMKRYEPAAFSSYLIWSGSVLLLPFIPGAVSRANEASITTSGAIVYLSVFPTVIGFYSWSFVLSHLPASKTVSFLYMMPVVAVLLEWIIFRELPRSLTAVGGLFSLVGVVLVNTSKFAKNKNT
ncbi:EamA family transporter [bacterium]|nr:EamA family transporter [bacterium]